MFGQIAAQTQTIPSPSSSQARQSAEQPSPSSAGQSNPGVQTEQGQGKPAEQSAVAGKSEDKNDKTEKSKWHVRLGTATVSASYVRLPDNFFLSPFYPYGLYPYRIGYSPYFYDPFYSPYYSPYVGGFAYAEDKGKVELVADAKNAEVYLDGAYAGLAANLKRMWLRPGAYDLTVAAPDGSAFQQRIYVLSGKSLKIRAKLVPPNVHEKPEEKQP
jgi:PEGA domain